MKKTLSVILSITLILCVPVSVAAQGKKSEPLPLVLVRGMDFLGLYVDEGTENERPVFGEVEAQDIIKTLLMAGVSAGLNGSFDSAVDQLIVYVRELLECYACDKTGASIYNISPRRYPEALSAYPDYQHGNSYEPGMIKRAVELYGAENVYYFTYDWRMNPLDVADEIAQTVDKAIADTGKSKVNLINCSMGGVMTVAYMTKYGYEKLNKCVFITSTVGGVDMVGKLFQGKIVAEPDALYNYLATQFKDEETNVTVFKLLKLLGVFDGVTNFANNFFDTYKQKVYDDLLIEYFGTMLSMWAIIPPEDYDACVKYMFAGKEEEYEVLIQKADELQQMMIDRDDMLLEAADNGVGIALITAYNFSGFPLCEGASSNGDGVIETRRMSNGASVAEYGKTLDESIINSGSPYVSADGVIDASTALLADSTWFFKDSPHLGCKYGSEQSDFLFWLLGFDGAATVTSNARYPQFMQSSVEEQFLAPLV